jgi:hypothetical protein
MRKSAMKLLKYFLAVSSISVLFACGGGGGGSAGSTPAQLAATVIDLSSYKNTFADTTLVNGQVLTAGFSLESLLARLRIRDFFPLAYAQSLTSCNDNVKPVAIDTTSVTKQYKKLPLTAKEDDKPCFTSSQEVGPYIAAQAKNLYQGSKKCDIVLMPKAGGKLHCLEVGIPASVSANAGTPEFKFSQAFAGLASLKSLGGKITDNGKYFFVAFSDDGTRTKGYDGVYRIDLSAAVPVGQLAYVSEGVNPRTLSFDGYQQLENGDMIVSRMDLIAPMGSRRYFTYYVGVNDVFPGVAAQQVVLINNAVEYQYDGVNSPIFTWAKNNLAVGGEAITDGGSQNIVFSGSQDPAVKVFYYVIYVNRYQRFTGSYFNSLLIKGTVRGDTIAYEDYGPTSISFFGTAGVKSDLSRIYWVKDWNPGQISVVTRNLAKQVNVSDPNYMPDAESALNVSMPSDYKPTLLYTTQNKIFVSTIQPDFYDSQGLMNLKIYVADKVVNGVEWTDRPGGFSEIDLTGYTGNNFRLESVIPSLVSDKLTLRLSRVADGNKFSLDASSVGIDVIDLGARGAVSGKHAVVSGR